MNVTWDPRRLALGFSRQLLRRIPTHLLSAFGALWLTLEILDFFWHSLASELRQYWWAFLLLGAIIALLRSVPRTSVRCKITNRDAAIEIRAADVLELAGAVVIGTNTTFDTEVSDGTISPRSLQGQFTSRYFPDVEILDAALEKGLRGISCNGLTRDEKPYGKLDEYPVGTVANVPSSAQAAYFVAIAKLNEARVASATAQDIQDALPRLWEHVRTKGRFGPICIPLLGTGFARTQVTRERIIHEIIKSFVAASSDSNFCEHLTIAISPEDYFDGKVNIERVGHFLQHVCDYASPLSLSAPAIPVGTPVRTDAADDRDS